MTILTKEDYNNIECKLFFGFYPEKQNNMLNEKELLRGQQKEEKVDISKCLNNQRKEIYTDLEKAFAEDFPNTWGNKVHWNGQINLKDPTEDPCIIYIDNEGNEISRYYGNKSTVDKMRPLATEFMYKLEQQKIKIIMKQEIEQLIEKYNGLLVATTTEILQFKEELLYIVDKQFE